MLRLALLSLVCAVTCGVFGFGGNSATSSVLAQNLFFLFLVVALAGFLGGTLSGAGEKAYLDQSQMDATRIHGEPVAVKA